MANDDPPRAGADTGSSRSRSGATVKLSIALVVAGVVAMVVPGLLRDGVCGLLACADETPGVAVGRPNGTTLEVVVPAEAAAKLRSLRLIVAPRSADGADEGDEEGDPLRWVVARSGEGEQSSIPLGEAPEGFETRVPLTEPPTEGLWVLDASFGCASTVVRFRPEDVDPGYVTSGSGPVTRSEFLDGANTKLRCTAEAPGWQRWLFVLGALMASVGAVLGIVVALRRPPSADDDADVWVDETEDW